MSIFPSLACPKLVLTFYFALVTFLEDVTKTGNGERGTGNGERGTENGERETGNGKRETGNGKRGTGNGESLKWGIFKMGNL